MDITKKKLGILLSTGPEHPNLDAVLGLGTAALSRGADLYLYLIDAGARAPAARGAVSIPIPSTTASGPSTTRGSARSPPVAPSSSSARTVARSGASRSRIR